MSEIESSDIDWDNAVVHDPVVDPQHWVVCPACDEIVPRNEANEHVCPIEGEEDA